MTTKKDVSTITIALPASGAACDAVISSIMQAVPDDIRAHVAGNLLLEWERSGLLSQSLSAAGRQMCADGLRVRGDDVKRIVNDYMESAHDELRQRCDDIFSEQADEIIKGKLTILCESVIAKAKQNLTVKSERVCNEALVSFKQSVEAEIPKAAVRMGEQIAQDLDR